MAAQNTCIADAYHLLQGKRAALAGSTDEALLGKLGEVIQGMKDDFMVVHFREPCSFCRKYLSDEPRCVRRPVIVKVPFDARHAPAVCLSFEQEGCPLATSRHTAGPLALDRLTHLLPLSQTGTTTRRHRRGRCGRSAPSRASAWRRQAPAAVPSCRCRASSCAASAMLPPQRLPPPCVPCRPLLEYLANPLLAPV